MDKGKLIFLDWTRPLLTTAAEGLYALGRGSFPADFSHLRIAVPTAEAGRLLRERVALLCSDRGGAVALDITMPERLAAPRNAAGPAQVLLAWRTTLLEADKRDFPELFRNDVLDRARRSEDMLLGWGEILQKCRMDLAREGLGLADAAEKLDAICRRCAGERQEEKFLRFREFAFLETLYRRTLGQLTGSSDPADALLEAMKKPELPDNVEKLILIDCADLGGAPRCWLNNLRGDVEVEFWINADGEKYRDRFDAFGRPDPEFWNSVAIDVDPEKQLRIVPRPDQQAEKLLEMLSASADKPEAIAVLDPEVAGSLETHAELARQDDRRSVPQIFVPGETVLTRLPWSRLLTKIVALAGNATVETAAAVWRDPFFHDYARSKLRIADLEAALRLLDKFRAENLLNDLPFLETLLDRGGTTGPGGRIDPGAARSLEALVAELKKWREELSGAGSVIRTAFGILAAIGGALDVGLVRFNRSEAELRQLGQIVAEIDALPVPPDVLPLLLRRRLAATELRIREESPEAVDAVGFLEIPWRDLDTVLIAGFNDEHLSPGNGDDLFLPEDARAELDMPTRDRRRAADALRFKALTMRRDTKLFLLCGRSTQSGEKLLPARLLFQCAREELPRRVRLLFDDTLVDEPPPPSEGAPPLLPRVEKPERMRITGFKSYLESPFAYYLQQVLKIEYRAPAPLELDALGYGTVAHDVLEKCPRAGTTDANALARAMCTELAKQMRAKFGGDPPGLLRIQHRLLEQSLNYFAAVQCGEYGAGWRIIATELPVSASWGDLFRAVFPGEPEPEWRGKVSLSGKIDRIDRRVAADGNVELRVLDYKTSAKAVAPDDAHLSTAVPDWGEAERQAPPILDKMVRKELKTRYWKDLQLPLYLLLTRHFLAGKTDAVPFAENIGAGYFNLPLEKTSTAVSMFEHLPRTDVLESAVRCADMVLRRIFVEGNFLPLPKSRLEVFPGCSFSAVDFGGPVTAEKPGESS